MKNRSVQTVSVLGFNSKPSKAAESKVAEIVMLHSPTHLVTQASRAHSMDVRATHEESKHFATVGQHARKIAGCSMSCAVT